MIKGLELHPEDEARLRAPYVQPEEEKAPGRPYSTFQYLKGAYRKAGEGLRVRGCRDRTKENSSKFKRVDLD